MSWLIGREFHERGHEVSAGRRPGGKMPSARVRGTIAPHPDDEGTGVTADKGRLPPPARRRVMPGLIGYSFSAAPAVTTLTAVTAVLAGAARSASRSRSANWWTGSPRRSARGW